MHTPIIVTGGRSPVIILVPVIISVSLSLAVMVAVMISMMASTPATPASVPTQSESRPGRLAVMEVDPGRGLVGVLGDAEVHSDFKAGYLGSIHRLSRLLRVLDPLEVDESESPGSLGRAVQHHRHLLQLAESAELSLEVPLCGCEVETKHSNAVRRFGIFTIAINLRKIVSSLVINTA